MTERMGGFITPSSNLAHFSLSLICAMTSNNYSVYIVYMYKMLILADDCYGLLISVCVCLKYPLQLSAWIPE